jgi:predicted RNase H-like nuclease (RuvC/YqgF family)
MIIIPGDVIYLRDPSGGSHRTAEELCNRQVRAIVSSTPNFSHLALQVFQEYDIPIFTEEEVGAIWIDNFVLVSRDLLEKRMSFIELNRAVEAYNEEEDPLDLTEIILNYKKERRKELTQFIKVEDDDTSSHEMD